MVFAFHNMTKEQVRMLADRKYQTKLESDAFVSGWEYSQPKTKKMPQTNNKTRERMLKWSVIAITIVSMIETITILTLLLTN